MILNLRWYIENGCELKRPNDQLVLEGLYNLTQGNPCEGCNYKPTCPAWATRQKMNVRHGYTVTLQQAMADVQQAADQMVPVYGANVVNVERIKAVTSLYQAETTAAADLATELMTLPAFLEGCRRAGVEPTRRQANKCLRKEGLVFDTMVQIARETQSVAA